MTVDADDYGPAARRRRRAERAGMVETAALDAPVEVPAAIGTRRIRLRLVELAAAVIVTAVAIGFLAARWDRPALAAGLLSVPLWAIWVAAVVVERIESTPIVLQDPSIADQYGDTY